MIWNCLVWYSNGKSFTDNVYRTRVLSLSVLYENSALEVKLNFVVDKIERAKTVTIMQNLAYDAVTHSVIFFPFLQSTQQEASQNTNSQLCKSRVKKQNKKASEYARKQSF